MSTNPRTSSSETKDGITVRVNLARNSDRINQCATLTKGASTLRFCAFSVDEDKVRGYLRDLERICQTKVAMNLSRLLKTIDARGTV